MSNIKVSVILPTYNEAGNIIKLIELIQSELKKSLVSHEVIVVDDDSKDKTGVLAQKYFSNSPNIRVIIRKKDKGLATAIEVGLGLAVGEILLVMDSDFNHDPKVLPKMVDKIEKYDFVVGSRFIKDGGMSNKTREMLSRLFNIMIRVILGSPVHDNLSGFFAIKREHFDNLNKEKIFWGYGDYFIRMIYFSKINKLRFAEVPSYYKEREYGVSKSQFVSMFWDYLISTISLRVKGH